jgi:hypothetical protein
MDNSQTLFLMHITGGYAFRNAIGMIKNETFFATMILSPKTIEISFVNTSKRASHKIMINTSELTLYSYNFKDSEGNLLPEYPIAFETNELFNTTKTIGRRDAIRLYWVIGENRFSVQPIKNSTKDPGKASALFVNILNKEYVKFDNAGGYNAEPNVRVPAKDFAELCSQSNTLKCSGLEIVGDKNCVTFKGIQANNVVASINKFTSQNTVNSNPTHGSNLDEIDMRLSNLHKEAHTTTGQKSLSLNIVSNEALMTVNVPISTVKALSKIHNISPPGTLLKFYFKENRPTKLESPIDTYGTYVICLRNPRN